ncbi:hypothetical protein ELH51_05900 [Rhizobium ruizarguesonis]|uniref:hypothetical protein n=1 Tax=Rhizobium ruizarguesonis TaxID=2081791 RepID=UPI001031EE78|nr:hypothetical protein [Rhizobium ruizarguesonis]TBB21342.1 hypothetical protein ELH51_05900 [Rhizobium ruizarguesonis]
MNKVLFTNGASMKISSAVRHQMIAKARAAIDHGLVLGNPMGVRAPRTEPGLVAAVTTYAIPRIARDWRRILKPLRTQFEVSAVFTHQAPKVRFASGIKARATCELADLLIVVDDARTGRRQAALIQAKMAGQRGTVQISRQQDKLQLELFQKWPRFDFEEPIYNLAGVDFHSGGSAAECGRYGVIDRHLISPPIWSQMPPSTVPGKTLGAPMLADFIVGLVSNRVGREATPSLASDWSKTVEALMTVTYGRFSHQRQSLGPLAFPRGNTTQAFLLQGSVIQTSISTDGLLPVDAEPEPVFIDEEPPNGALSVIRIGLTE